MGSDPAAFAREGTAGPAAKAFSAACGGGYLLRGSRGDRLANVAQRLPALAAGVLLFRKVAEARGVGTTQWETSRSSSSQERKKKAPSAAILDSASVRMAGQRGDRGFDAGKKVDGRKRHLLVDTLGLILSVVVHSASIQDRDGAKLVLEKARWFGWLSKIWADGGYAGALVQWVRKARLGRGARLEIVSKAPGAFQVLPKRWIVERTHAWLSRYRRLARDYEEFTTHSEAFTYVAASAMMTRRLAKIGKR